MLNKDTGIRQSYFRDGERKVHRPWEETMSTDAEELTQPRQLLYNEPHVRGPNHGQHSEEEEPRDAKRFEELADQWESETALLSNSSRAAEHPAHQQIIRMGEPAVALILKRMQSRGGHWFRALRYITDADPVNPEDRGNISAMQASWLDWGKRNGFA